MLNIHTNKSLYPLPCWKQIANSIQPEDHVLLSDNIDIPKTDKDCSKNEHRTSPFKNFLWSNGSTNTMLYHTI